jgi:hypothetical protein
MQDILVEFRIHYYSAVHVALLPLTPGFLQCAAQLTSLIGTLFAVLRTLSSHYDITHSPFSCCAPTYIYPQYKHILKFSNSVVLINEEEEPTRCYLVFYYTYGRLNMFQAALCSSSRAHNYISDCHMDRLIFRLLMVGS